MLRSFRSSSNSWFEDNVFVRWFEDLFKQGLRKPFDSLDSYC
jgi:hypothetical protein